MQTITQTITYNFICYFIMSFFFHVLSHNLCQMIELSLIKYFVLYLNQEICICLLHYKFMYRQQRKSFLSSKHTLILIFPEHFCFHGKNSVFLNSDQKRDGKHSFAPPHPLTLLTTPLSSLYPSSL